MVIYSPTGTTLLDIPVDDNSYRYRAIRQGDKVYLYYSLAEYVELPVGSYIEYQGETYTLWRPEDFTKHGTRNMEYAVTFGGAWELLKCKIKLQVLWGCKMFLSIVVVVTPKITTNPLFPILSLILEGIVYSKSK